MELERHLRSYQKLHEKWDALSVGANDVELDQEGNAVGVFPDDPPALDYNKIYGGDGSDEIPWFFQGGRKIPTSRRSRFLTMPSSRTAFRERRCSR